MKRLLPSSLFSPGAPGSLCARLLLLILLLPATGWANRAYYKLITCSDAHVGSDLSGFPVCVDIVNDTDLGSHAKSDGSDVAFFDTDGTTALSFRVVKAFAVTSGQANATYEVKCNLTHSSNKVIRIAYGDAGASASDSATLSIANQIGHWSLDVPTISGTTAKDTSGSSKDGTLVATPSAVTGKIGQAYQFNGTSQYVDTATPGVLDGLTNLSICFWMYRTGSDANYSAAWGQGSGSGLCFMELDHGGNVRLYFEGSSTQDWSFANSVLDLNAWDRIVIIRTTSTLDVYKNGSSVASTSQAGAAIHSAVSTFFRMGENGTGSAGVTSRLVGNLDDFCIFNATLSTDWITADYYYGVDRTQLSFGSEQSSGGGASPILRPPNVSANLTSGFSGEAQP